MDLGYVKNVEIVGRRKNTIVGELQGYPSVSMGRVHQDLLGS